MTEGVACPECVTSHTVPLHDGIPVDGKYWFMCGNGHVFDIEANR